MGNVETLPRSENRSATHTGDEERFGPFVERHVGPDGGEIRAMLDVVGAASLGALIDETVPTAIRQSSPLELPQPLSEPEALARLAELAGQNEVKRSLIGMGYYGTHTPSVLLRNLFENPGWYTAYTPYQAEVSQGRLEALLNWQQAVIDLTGMEIANASLLDEATAAAEAMTLARRSSKSKANAFFVDADTHPQTKAVLATRAVPLGIELVEGDPLDDLQADQVFGALLAYPGSSGEIRDLRAAAEALHAAGAIVTVASDLLALCLLEAPGKWGADIVLGSAQRFGVPMGMGGPHAAFFAAKDAVKRSIPGRIIGVSQDARGKPALRMALQTREQHIRREKATSNICTAQVLLAVMAGMYAVWHGGRGLEAIARRVHGRTAELAGRLDAAGIKRVNDHFFDTLTLSLPGKAGAVLEAAAQAGFNLRPIDADHLALSLDETVTAEEVDQLASLLGAAKHGQACCRPARAAGPPEPLSHPPGLRHASQRDPDAALSPQAAAQGSGARSLDDPLGLLHHEAQCGDRDDAGEHGRLRAHPPLRAEEPDHGLPGAVRRPRGLALPDHRLRRRLAAAQCRQPGRVCRSPEHPRLSPLARRCRARCLPHSVIRARHQPGQRRHGRHARRGGRL